LISGADHILSDAGSRALLRIDQKRSPRWRVSLPIIQRMEASEGEHARGDDGGCGVRLKQPDLRAGPGR
jgi:hypothetical protein